MKYQTLLKQWEAQQDPWYMVDKLTRLYDDARVVGWYAKGGKITELQVKLNTGVIVRFKVKPQA